MLFLFLALIFVIAIYGPTLWVHWVMSRHGKHIDAIPGTGCELAQHLIDRFELKGVQVEEGGKNVNHFDPSENMVRLSPEIYSGKSLTAIAIATHEVGHAIQYYKKENLIVWRTKMLPKISLLEKLSVALLMLIPMIGVATKVPIVMVLMFLLLFVFMASRIFFHLLTLPVEWDASFNKALPILIEGDYVSDEKLPAIKHVLKAAAFTYVAAALADLVSIWRWIRFIR